MTLYLSKGTHRFSLKQKADGQIVVLIDQPFEVELSFPFDWQYYHELRTYYSQKRIYLHMKKDEKSLTIGQSIHWLKLPIGSRLADKNVYGTTIYYLKELKNRQKKDLEKIMYTLEREVNSNKQQYLNHLK